MLRELCQLGVSADESGGVLELCCLAPLIPDGVASLLLQLFLHLLFLSSSEDRGALHLIKSSSSADLS
jgi:hypothetical protein